MKHRARKRFGQNFLHDQAVIDQLIHAIHPRAGERFIEIGPGHGALTRPLLAHGVDLHVVEIDRDLAQRWSDEALTQPRLHVHTNDALKMDWAPLLAGPPPARLVGNLPYNISTPLLFRFAQLADQLHDLHLMLQKEVVDRLCAAHGNKTYGRLTVMLAPYFACERLLQIDPQAFKPAPRVQSAFVRLTPYREPPFVMHHPDGFKAVVAAAFSMRRKTLRNALRALLDAQDIQALGIDPGARPETLSPADFARLGDVVAQLQR